MNAQLANPYLIIKPLCHQRHTAKTLHNPVQFHLQRTTDYKQHIKQFENHLGKKSKLNYRVQIIEIAHASVGKKKTTTNPQNSPT